VDTRNDIDQHVPEADYTAHVDHLNNCAECGRTRCLAGETLCKAYLTRVRGFPSRADLPWYEGSLKHPSMAEGRSRVRPAPGRG